MKACCVLRIACSAQPSGAAGFQKIERADHVGVDEVAGAGNRAVHMRFGGQVHDMGDGMALHDFKDGILVAQVNLFEGVFWVPGNALEILPVSSVSQAIEVDQLAHFRLVNDVLNEI